MSKSKLEGKSERRVLRKTKKEKEEKKKPHKGGMKR
jgi:hypothetical protein